MVIGRDTVANDVAVGCRGDTMGYGCVAGAKIHYHTRLMSEQGRAQR